MQLVDHTQTLEKMVFVILCKRILPARQKTSNNQIYFYFEQILSNLNFLSDRAVISALNANWRLVMNSFFPALFPVSDVLMRDFFKRFFKKYPFDILFPKRTKAPKRGNQ